MKKQTIIVINFSELIKRTAEEQNLSDNYKSVIDKKKETITITDEEEVLLPDMQILLEQSSARVAIANKILSSLRDVPKESLKIKDLCNATPDLVNLSRGEKPKVARLKSFYDKYSEKKVSDMLPLKFSEVKEALGYNSYGLPSHKLLIVIFQMAGFTGSYPFFLEP